MTEKSYSCLVCISVDLCQRTFERQHRTGLNVVHGIGLAHNHGPFVFKLYASLIGQIDPRFVQQIGPRLIGQRCASFVGQRRARLLGQSLGRFAGQGGPSVEQNVRTRFDLHRASDRDGQFSIHHQFKVTLHVLRELGAIFMRFITGDVQCSGSLDVVGFFTGLNINGAIALFQGVYLSPSFDRGCQGIFNLGQ